MNLTSKEIKDVTSIMKLSSENFFSNMETKINNPASLDDIKNQIDWLDVLDKSKKTINILWDYVGKGAEILLVDGKLFTKKWYNLYGVLKLIKLGKLFFDLILDTYKIWKPKDKLLTGEAI